MKLAAGVFDIWTFRRDSDAIRFLLLYTSQTKADRHFNGGRFWQIPSNFVRDNETIEEAIIRCLGLFGLTAATIWAGEHAYVIYNRRFREAGAGSSNLLAPTSFSLIRSNPYSNPT